MQRPTSFLNACQAIVFAAGLALGALAHAAAPAKPAPSFEWESSEPLIHPPADAKRIFGVKDPSIVYHDGRYHVFMTTAGADGWGMAYTSFATWDEAPEAPLFMLDKSPIGPGYRAAPQVYYFAPQKLWYLIYQGGDPMYSTTRDIGDPRSWTAPKPFYPAVPASVKNAKGEAGWLDFWNICDDRKCYLFFTNDGGSFYRAETAIERFPHGFSEPVVVMKEKREDLFEASNTYRITGTQKYLTLVEAMGPAGRYFRAWTADRLDGEWQPVPGAKLNLFAGADNVRFKGRAWSEGISHGEMVRDGVDQTLSIDPCRPLQFLYQGLDMEKGRKYEYIELPYRLGLITATAPNAISELCKR
ncbi:non-reducing end alpha-L-arabinofuranosidase family hydrolase [Roseateles sp. BYS78W]|uniref:Alpha-L-arabinofuranosidase n=1 Tax=Pelomonas candidula TaxID=3299025 RepID=A0ABW7HF11_9BURK